MDEPRYKIDNWGYRVLMEPGELRESELTNEQRVTVSKWAKEFSKRVIKEIKGE